MKYTAPVAFLDLGYGKGCAFEKLLLTNAVKCSYFGNLPIIHRRLRDAAAMEGNNFVNSLKLLPIEHLVNSAVGTYYKLISKKTNMIKSSFFLLGAFILVSIVACTQAPDSDNATTTEPEEVVANSTSNESLNVDIANSKIKWVGTKVTGYHSGPLKLKSGEMMVESGRLTGGKFVIDLTTISVTGPQGSQEASNAKLTAHLRSADFFDVNNYPDASFEITNVEPYDGKAEPEVVRDVNRLEDINEYRVSNPSHMVSGNLTIKNITKNIQFPALISVSENSVEATAKFNIDRLQWDIVYPGKPDDLIRNEIHLGLLIKATK